MLFEAGDILIETDETFDDHFHLVVLQMWKRALQQVRHVLLNVEKILRWVLHFGCEWHFDKALFSNDEQVSQNL